MQRSVTRSITLENLSASHLCISSSGSDPRLLSRLADAASPTLPSRSPPPQGPAASIHHQRLVQGSQGQDTCRALEWGCSRQNPSPPGREPLVCHPTTTTAQRFKAMISVLTLYKDNNAKTEIEQQRQTPCTAAQGINAKITFLYAIQGRYYENRSQLAKTDILLVQER